MAPGEPTGLAFRLDALIVFADLKEIVVSTFRAFWVEKGDAGFSRRVVERSIDELPEGDVDAASEVIRSVMAGAASLYQLPSDKLAG